MILKESNAFSGFSVDDLQKAKKIYSKILGLKSNDHPMGFLEMHLRGNNPLVLYPKPDHIPATFTIINFPVMDIEKAVDELTSRRVHFEQFGGNLNTDEKGNFRGGKPLIAWYKDPARNILSVLEELH